jgi:lysozyme family protein
MQQDLQEAFTDILRWEGGWTEADSEPGGASNWGISMVSYGDYCKKHKLPEPTKDDLKALTSDKAITFYEDSWVNQINFDALPVGVDLQMLNIAINLGVVGGIKLLQAEIESPQTGKMDWNTVTSLKAFTAPDRAASLVAALGAGWLKNKSQDVDWPKYKAGWTNREVSITNSALTMINNQIATANTSSTGNTS